MLCNNNKITACIVDLFNSFCKDVYAVAFFKVVQQQSIGQVGNAIALLWADNCCLQQWKHYYNSTVFAKDMLKWKKGPVFWLTVYLGCNVYVQRY